MERLLIVTFLDGPLLGLSCDAKILTCEKTNARIVSVIFQQRRSRDAEFADCVARYFNDNQNEYPESNSYGTSMHKPGIIASARKSIRKCSEASATTILVSLRDCGGARSPSY